MHVVKRVYNVNSVHAYYLCCLELCVVRTLCPAKILHFEVSHWLAGRISSARVRASLCSSDLREDEKYFGALPTLKRRIVDSNLKFFQFMLFDSFRAKYRQKLTYFHPRRCILGKVPNFYSSKFFVESEFFFQILSSDLYCSS